MRPHPLSPCSTGLFLFLVTVGAAQGLDAQRDSTGTDSTRARALPDVMVTVTRHRVPVAGLPAAVTVVDREDITAARRTLGLDEALSGVAGVYVADRGNFSLDQRLSIRGFGSRANFGMRGLRLILDGVPQTLPDGQSQLTNLDLAAVQRIEVLHGASSALYGNAGGGVIQFETREPEIEGTTTLLRVQAGSDGMTRAHSWTGHRTGGTTASLALSRTDLDGFREHSAARMHQAAVRVGHSGGTWSLGMRGAFTDAPRAQNPGALTLEEATDRPRMAAPNNVARGADKDVSQTQLSFHATRRWGAGLSVGGTVFGLWRDLENPLATPPPGAVAPTEGTFNRIDRRVVGSRLEAVVPFAGGDGTITSGLDWQRMRDDRFNFRSDRGRITTDLLVDQRETVTEVGPFVQGTWTSDPFTVEGGIRYDWISFVVDDRLDTGTDHSGGRRVMASLSGSAGIAYRLGEALSAYVTLGTAFESPTSTELVNRPDGTIGLHPDLDPQRSTSLEWGLRGAVGAARFRFAAYRIGVRDALIQAREQDGRAFFQNAGRVRHQGLEADLRITSGRHLAFHGAYTLSDLRFLAYRVPAPTGVDTLDGNRLPGVPMHRLRVGVRGELGQFSVGVDHTLTSAVWANDANTLQAPDWGAGVTDLRIGWMAPTAGFFGSPFAGIENLFGKRYIGSVTVNGFGGRVFEPAAGRQVYLGVTTSFGWPPPAPL